MATGRVAIITGTRPEIIKLRHICHALGPGGAVVHTSQHEDPGPAGWLTPLAVPPARTPR